MAITLESISKATAIKAPRIVIFGTEKIGKTTFAAGAPDPILLPIKGEEGADGIGVPAFPTLTTHSQVIEALAALYSGEHDHKTIIIDSTSTLEPLIVDAALKAEGVSEEGKLGGGYGHQYDTPALMWREITDGLDALREAKGMSSILIGHAEIRTHNDPDSEPYDQYTLSLNKKARALLFRWADVILFAHSKTYTKKDEAGFGKKRTRATGTGERVLFTQQRPSHPGGGRNIYGRLPYELALDWQAFQAAVSDAAAQWKPGTPDVDTREDMEE